MRALYREGSLEGRHNQSVPGPFSMLLGPARLRRRQPTGPSVPRQQDLALRSDWSLVEWGWLRRLGETNPWLVASPMPAGASTGGRVGGGLLLRPFKQCCGSLWCMISAVLHVPLHGCR